jgi:hypothetical protein
MRVSISAIESVTADIGLPKQRIRGSPPGFGDPGDFPLQRQLAEMEAAHLELAQVAARPPTDQASIPVTNLELELL